MGSSWEGSTCGVGGEQFEEKVMSWAHTAKGTTKRLFQAGTALSEACSLWGLDTKDGKKLDFLPRALGTT